MIIVIMCEWSRQSQRFNEQLLTAQLGYTKHLAIAFGKQRIIDQESCV